ncbi:hypothetical protein [Flavisphingomonas formosensis]|uniref:hypothetical protein n=1 Tax=Flavisphingomonas formosensis TaxID=861534 RepID=UPI0012F8434F|nr:hypothetical protein [Sphingomonas formosensis]
MARHRDGRIDIGLRTGGLMLVGAAAGTALLLRVLTIAHAGRPGPLELLLAAILFLCGSVGAALLFTGAHIFDRIELASRWRSTQFFPVRRPVEPRRIAVEEMQESAELRRVYAAEPSTAPG